MEILETLAPLLQTHRTLRQDSGGAGKFRGGLGQATEMRCLSGKPWEVSAMIDRVRYPGAGLQGGASGATGRFLIDDVDAAAKSLLPLAAEALVTLDLPGGGGFGDAMERPAEAVLQDVVEGYVSLAAAEREYGVAIRYVGRPEQVVRLRQHYEIDAERTAALRS